VFEEMSSVARTFWRSAGLALAHQSYEALVPQGLHVGCGIARLRTEADGIGGFTADGPAINLLRCAQTTTFRSQLSPGQTRSCGLWLDTDQVDAATGIVADLIEAAGDAPTLRASTAIPARIVARLCAPIDPWFDGAGRDLVVESRALELIAAVMTWLVPRSAESRRVLPRRQVLAARDLIESRLTDPPTLREIARSVGLNERSLTTGFRQAFGVSVAAFVTARRLDLAATLLSEGASPGEVARQVGYRPTHLATAFRNRFGVSPSRYRAGDSS
jgi:AraC-like DNA-binding protein